MIDTKLHLIVNSTLTKSVICVLEDTRRSIVSRNNGEPGISVVEDTGHLPVCRGLAPESQQHALKMAFRMAVDNSRLTDLLKG